VKPTDDGKNSGPWNLRGPVRYGGGNDPLFMKSTVTSPAYISHDRIAARARELWEAAGHPTDRDLEFWFQAERQLNAAVPAAATVAPAAPSRRSASKKTRDVDGLGEKTEEMLGRTGPTSSDSPTSLNLGPR